MAARYGLRGWPLSFRISVGPSSIITASVTGPVPFESEVSSQRIRALLEQAKLNLRYCTIVAPVTGIVGKNTVELSENVSPGEQMMAVVPLDDIPEPPVQRPFWRATVHPLKKTSPELRMFNAFA